MTAVSDKKNRQLDKSSKAFRTISEAALELGLPQHVLRFWETKFPQINPMKRAGGRRFYRPEDLKLLNHIKCLLHSEGYTIKGVQNLLKKNSGNNLALTNENDKDKDTPTCGPNIDKHLEGELRAAISDLEKVRTSLTSIQKMS